ncbi:hypothetical protein VPHK348_0052 [Vibrio phage K348]|jgi:hypothetical protein|uniref:Uncharacterized protein n=1 Tax=Vibrio splendidus TaxID=29497 RepID=A0A0H3ZUZ0_VIBSP|nr:hypothetical protein [Vibrio splendidus]MCP4867076.1 hypothetical protein [Alteromonas sp.]CAK2912775.1 hypothetical protein VCRA2110O183_420043 [Vibrio crassostreae]CAK3524151.1 hypothetical protein VCRA2128O309_700025 [Vibrio crassostreae]
MLKTSDPRHPINGAFVIKPSAKKAKKPATDHRVRRQIEAIHEQRALDNLFAL